MTVLLLLLLAQAAPESHTLEELRRAAAASRLQDDPAAAEQSLLEAAPIAARLYGDTSLELASLLSELSGVKRALGKRTDAVLALESVLRMRELQPFQQPMDYVTDLLKLASLRAEMDEAKAARELWTRAIAACDSSLPPESPQCLAALEALAGSMRDESEYAEAEPLYLRSLALRQAAFGARFGGADLYARLAGVCAIRTEEILRGSARLRAPALVVGGQRRGGASHGRPHAG